MKMNIVINNDNDKDNNEDNDSDNSNLKCHHNRS